MKTEQQLRKAIMRRVYGIYLMRQAMKPAVRLTAFLSVLLVVAFSVSMPNVIANALQSSDIVHFALAAVTGTTVYVQLGVLIAGLILVSALADALRPRSHAPMYV